MAVCCGALDLSIHAVVASCFFFNDTATTEIYTLSLHDALPISRIKVGSICVVAWSRAAARLFGADRKSTRLNSSHTDISRMPSSACKKILHAERSLSLALVDNARINAVKRSRR